MSEPVQGVDGSYMQEILVPNNTLVFVGIQACNRNKAIWGEDALEWKPERWLNSLPNSIKEAKVPGIYANLWVSSLVYLPSATNESVLE